MCRLAGYLGEPLTLSTLTDDAPHALYRQSYAAKELESAVVCADGWGAAWYLADDDVPCLYRCTLPIWADVNRTHLGRTIRSHCVLAAVRSATDPLTVAHANTQPFASGSLTVVHNGYVDNFASLVLGPLRSGLSAARHATINGNTDSEHLAALIFDEHARLETESPGQRLLLGVGNAVRRFERLIQDAGTRAIMSLVVTDGSWLVGARSAVGGPAPSLYCGKGAAGVTLASEPLDERATWTAVPPRRLIVTDRAGSLEDLPL